MDFFNDVETEYNQQKCVLPCLCVRVKSAKVVSLVSEMPALPRALQIQSDFDSKKVKVLFQNADFSGQVAACIELVLQS